MVDARKYRLFKLKISEHCHFEKYPEYVYIYICMNPDMHIYIYIDTYVYICTYMIHKVFHHIPISHYLPISPFPV